MSFNHMYPAIIRLNQKWGYLPISLQRLLNYLHGYSDLILHILQQLIVRLLLEEGNHFTPQVIAYLRKCAGML
jgi:hypothetical protein